MIENISLKMSVKFTAFLNIWMRINFMLSIVYSYIQKQ